MGFDISERARGVWDEWNLRGAVLCSLFFQVALIILAHKRKTGGRVIGAFTWLFYLLADWVAAFAIGLISSRLAHHYRGKASVNNQLAAFWAPFLLLHLGGPDAITSFSLEDNELWIRHLMGLVVQVGAVVYVFLQSLSLKNEYRIPTVLVFFAGVYKYAERSISLYKACLRNFKRSLLPKPDPGPNYALLMEDLSAFKDSHVQATIRTVQEIEKGKSNDSAERTSSQRQAINDHLRIVKDGHHFFETFKGLVVDHMFSFRERDDSRGFFFARTATDAFRVMEVELNFLYDVLHTKAVIVHCWIGYLCRFICTALLVACFPLLPDHNVFHFDEILTYVLLGGAVALDVVGVFNLVLSDWALVSAGKLVSEVLSRLGSWRSERRRWSNTIGQHSLISFCVKEDGGFIRWLNKIGHRLGVDGSLDVEWEACEKMLKEFVFDELKAKGKKAASTKDAKEIYAARGEYVLCDYPMHYSYPSIGASLSDEVEYDESLLMWHITTELCFFNDTTDEDERDSSDDGATKNIKLCKLLSDYMLYLLVMQPTLMSTVAGIAQIRYQDTCAEANMFFKRWESKLKKPRPPLMSRVATNVQIWFQDTWKKATKFFKRQQSENKTKPRDLEMEACKLLLGVKMTDAKPKQVKGDRSKSVLFDACKLANDLMKIEEDRTNDFMNELMNGLMNDIMTDLLNDLMKNEKDEKNEKDLMKNEKDLMKDLMKDYLMKKDLMKDLMNDLMKYEEYLMKNYLMKDYLMKNDPMKNKKNLMKNEKDLMEDLTKDYLMKNDPMKNEKDLMKDLMKNYLMKNFMKNDPMKDGLKNVLMKNDLVKDRLKKYRMKIKGRRWEMMGRIWVELLSYAASCCRPGDHARQLTKGGEFITFVWLLMVHFGLGEQFRIEAGDARANLLVVKR